MSIISSEKRFCFIHIERTGGTTIRHLLGAQLNNLELVRTANPSLEKTLATFPKAKDYYKFAFVRCPYDWLVSLYSHLITPSVHNTDYLYVKDLNFHDFIKWLDDVGMKRKETDKEHAYRTQTNSIFLNGELGVDDIYRFESICNDLGESNVNNLFKKLSLKKPEYIPMLNKSERPFDWYDKYDKKTLKLVNRIFADDFNNFNYGVLEK